MSLVTVISNLATRIATENKAIRTLLNGNVPDLSSLTTTDKTNLVAALNELKVSIGGAGAVINDTAASTVTVYSSTKTVAAIDAATAALISSAPGTLDTLKELADALGSDPNFATTTATSLGNRVRVDAVQAFTGPQQAQGRANIGAGVGSSNLAIGLATGTAADAALVGDTTTNFVTIFNAGLV